MPAPRLSLSARLVGVFLAITVLCFAAVGVILSQALSRRIYAQDDTSLVLSGRHLRRLVAELDAPAQIPEHRDRLTSLVLGDRAVAMRMLDEQGRALIDYDPSGIPVERPFVVSADHRILAKDVQNWTTSGGEPVRGVATHARLKDGSSVVIVVARVMSDRAGLLGRYRRLIAGTMLLAIAVAAALSWLLVRRALRPLRSMAASARAITAHRLDRRLDEHAVLELRELAQALNGMLGRLEQGFGRMWQFTTDLAHDLRTPIGNLRGATEVALTRPREPAEYQALLASNLEECERVVRMIESVLFLARAENPSFALHGAPLDTAEELALLAEYFEGPSAEAGVAIRVQAGPVLKADRELFRRAVGNLLANALRYTPRGGAIEVRATQQEGEIVVSVENPGEGIAAEHLDKLFDRFYRADRARSQSASSTGLGLAIVKTIMELHGGRAEASSRPGGPTRFSLRFPAV